MYKITRERLLNKLNIRKRTEITNARTIFILPCLNSFNLFSRKISYTVSSIAY